MPFRDFIRTLTGGSWDPPNHQNVKGHILEMSAEGQLRVKEFMSDLLLDGVKPSIAGDIWSDRGCSLMGVLGYGIDRSWVMREWLLAATPFGATRHTGEAIDQITVESLKRFVPTWTTQVGRCPPPPSGSHRTSAAHTALPPRGLWAESCVGRVCWRPPGSKHL